MKKRVDSFNMEFGYELLSAVPYAYELHLNGELGKTISGFDTKPLFYFSPEHEENTVTRGWHNMSKARRGGLPYTYIHNHEQPDKKFPPYKEHYTNDEYKWDKPTLVIGNRKNVEWSVGAINFFDEDILDWMFENLKDRYKIIYFSVNIPEELRDNVDPDPLDDEEIARKHGVTIFRELCEGKSWNETILKVFANCEHYITMNGGYAILASLFSGTNIVYSKPGQTQTREIEYKSFWRWYPNHNNVRHTYVPSYDDLKKRIKSLYINEEPTINIIIRTTRPNYLKRCMASIQEQNYQNTNVLLVCDSDKSVMYTRGYDARLIRVNRPKGHIPKVNDASYGKPFPYNKYLDYAQRRVKGYVMFLDDDDKFSTSDAVSEIAKHVEQHKVLIWKVKFSENDIKPSYSFGKEPKLYDIGGIGFCYHTDYVDLTDWSEWKRADYRTVKKLTEKLDVTWLDEVLTETQSGTHFGSYQDIDGYENKHRYRLVYPGGRVLEQYFCKVEIDTYREVYERQGIKIELIKD